MLFIGKFLVLLMAPSKLSARRIEKSHSETSSHEEVNRQLPITVFLSVLTCGRGAQEHSSRVLLQGR